MDAMASVRLPLATQYSAKLDCDLNWSPWVYAKVGAPLARAVDAWYGHGTKVHPALRVTVFGSVVGMPVTDSVAEDASLTAYISLVLKVVSWP